MLLSMDFLIRMKLLENPFLNPLTKPLKQGGPK
jgi:hypothetical protein